MGLDSIFWLSFVTIASGCVIKLASMIFKSRCKTCKLCCLEIVRDTEAEEREAELEMSNRQPNLQHQTSTNKL